MNGAMWTLDQLGARVRAALAVGYEPARSGRIRAVPDRRTIRYYTTLGLIDRPKAMRGRTALYGRKHLLQLVAIKRLQAERQTLNQIQVRLAGLTVRALSEIARVPEDSTPGVEAPGERPTATPVVEPTVADASTADDAVRRRGAFWSEPPASASVVPAEVRQHTLAALAHEEPEVAAATPAHLGSTVGAPSAYSAEALTGLRLDESATVLLRTSRALTPAEAQELGELAQPLMNYLRSRGLLFGEDSGVLPSSRGAENGGC